MSLARLMALWRLAPVTSVCVLRPGVAVAAMWELSSRDLLGLILGADGNVPSLPSSPQLAHPGAQSIWATVFLWGADKMGAGLTFNRIAQRVNDPGASEKRTQAYQLLSGTPTEQRPLNNPDACESWKEAIALIWSTFFTMPAEGNHCL